MALDLSLIEITKDERHKPLLREAYDYAMKNSEDDKSKTGAIIVNEYGKILVSGANHFPKGVVMDEKKKARPAVYDWVIHAEADVITQAAKKYGLTLEGMILYLLWFPCNKCAQLISDSGITQLISHKDMVVKGNGDGYGFEIAYEILKSKNIKMLMYDGKICGCKHLFRGDLWEP